MAKNRDLFDDSVMSFGEHLEVLRVHLIRAILGLAVGVAITMTFGESIVRIIRQPIDTALNQYTQLAKHPPVEDNIEGFNFWGTIWTSIKNQIVPPSLPPGDKKPELPPQDAAVVQRIVKLELSAQQLLQQLHEVAPEQFPSPGDELAGKTLIVDAASDEFSGFRQAIDKMDDPITLNVQEAFMTYIKVALISGLIVSSPWVFYQLWLFVAAGLYPHEQKYVYTYLPTSIGLFLGGVVFCYYLVFPVMLSFLLGFNVRMGLTAQIRISEWINFAVMMPLLFGVSFQLPLVMLFLQKINIFQVKDYREKRRLAILAIAFLAMILTPTPDPASMLLMMTPMLALYELGIGLCILTHKPDELESAPA